jgi:SPX domain protein involved in polyphosphate accumulation
MSPDLTDLDRFRYERKFTITRLTKDEIEAFIKLHPAVFSEIYHSRFVNNLYLDSVQFKNYFDHIEGLGTRSKVRIRWYGSLFGVTEGPMLQIKSKVGLVGTKDSFPLLPFSIGENLNLAKVLTVFEKSQIPEALRIQLTSLRLSVLIRYRRKYFQSADRSYRITLDSQMTCYRVQSWGNTFLQKSVDSTNTILELKYPLGEDHRVEQITNRFPFRLSKVSKYVTGLERLSFR